MSLITTNISILRWHILALLVVAMLGPWAFDQLNVPAQFPCSKPSVRLYADFCGYPMSGFAALAWISSGFFYTFNELISGNIAPILPDLIALLLVCLIVFPFFSTMPLLAKKTPRRLQVLNLIVWGLACVASLTIFVVQSQREEFGQFFHLFWGLLLYILLSIATMIFEILAFRASVRIDQTL